MSTPLRTYIAAPDATQPRLWYAWEALTRPLGYEPVRVEGASADVILGDSQDGNDGFSGLRLPLTDHLPVGDPRPLDIHRAETMDIRGRTLPVMGGGDIVSSAFLWLSGWQERAATARDEHGRFRYGASWQQALQCVDVPVVDWYRLHLHDQLKAAGIRQPALPPWAAALTFDIDALRKPRLGQIARALGKAVSGDVGEAVADLRDGVMADPWQEGLGQIRGALARRGFTGTAFFKSASRSPFDLPIRLRDLTREVPRWELAGFEIGFHPGYFAYDQPGTAARELRDLQIRAQRPVMAVRQHYLRWNENTPSQQGRLGLAYDASLGFAEREGFRHATSFPFRLYDFSREAPQSVIQIPLLAMDTTLYQYRKMDVESVASAINRMITAAREVGGCAHFLWHNTAFDTKEYPGRWKGLTELLNQLSAAKARTYRLSELPHLSFV
ncbi:hypothetical protein BH23BAC4_BH23BAC4_04960 [soil metagenome]